MANVELLLYIRKRQQQGANTNDIMNALVARGWKAAMVQEAFDSLAALPTPKAQVTKTGPTGYVIFFGGLFIVLTILLFTVPILLGVFSRDITSPDDQDISLDTTLLPEDQNAYYEVQKILDVMFYPNNFINKYLGNGNWIQNDPARQNILDKNSKLFLLADAILQKPKYQNPEIGQPADTAPYKTQYDENTNVMRSNAERLANVMQIRSLDLEEKKLTNDQLGEALKIVALGQLLAANEPSLSDYKAGLEVKKIGLETAVETLFGYKDLTFLQNQITKMDAYKNTMQGAVYALKKEYALEKTLISAAANRNLNLIAADFGFTIDPMTKIYGRNRYLFQPNKTIDITAQYFRQGVNDVQLSCAMVKDLQSRRQVVQNVFPLMTFQQNAVGVGIVHKIMNDIDISQLLDYRCRDMLLVNATQTMLALRAYYLTYGAYPKQLSDLVPQFVSEVPLDPYDENPLKYSTEKNIIYSVGINGKDEGGSQGVYWQLMPDPTFKLHIKKQSSN